MQKHWTWIQERPLSKVRFSSHSHSLIMRSESLCRVSQCLGTGLSTLRSVSTSLASSSVSARTSELECVAGFGCTGGCVAAGGRINPWDYWPACVSVLGRGRMVSSAGRRALYCTQLLCAPAWREQEIQAAQAKARAKEEVERAKAEAQAQVSAQGSRCYLQGCQGYAGAASRCGGLLPS